MLEALLETNYIRIVRALEVLQVGVSYYKV